MEDEEMTGDDKGCVTPGWLDGISNEASVDLAGGGVVTFSSKALHISIQSLREKNQARSLEEE